MVVIGIIFVHPTIQTPALTDLIPVAGPLIGGPVLSFIFIVIGCGSISGLHATIATGTTPKMLGPKGYASPKIYAINLLFVDQLMTRNFSFIAEKIVYLSLLPVEGSK